MAMSEYETSQPVISVFGSHAPTPGSDDYELAREIGKNLATNGFAVATGGYSGTMAAVSQGAAEAGGLVIGVTSERIEKIRQATLNPWVTTEIRYETLTERLLHLVTKNDGMIALPGGIGTLSEFALAWSFLQVQEIALRPFVLFGDSWRQMVATFVDPNYIAPEHLILLKFASDPKQAIDEIKLFYNSR